MNTYNPKFRDVDGEAKPFNFVPTQILTEVTDEERQQAKERLEALIRETHKELGLIN